MIKQILIRLSDSTQEDEKIHVVIKVLMFFPNLFTFREGFVYL